MNIRSKLVIILNFLLNNRRTGITTALAKACFLPPTPGILLMENERQARDLRREFGGDYVSIEDFARNHQLLQPNIPRPLFIDNYALNNLFSESALELQRLDDLLAATRQEREAMREQLRLAAQAISNLRQALTYYSTATKYEPPSDWHSPSEGRAPTLEDYEEMDDGEVAREALQSNLTATTILP